MKIVVFVFKQLFMHKMVMCSQEKQHLGNYIIVVIIIIIIIIISIIINDVIIIIIACIAMTRLHEREVQHVHRTSAHMSLVCHEYQCSKLKWAIMHEFFIVALNGDGNMILWHT